MLCMTRRNALGIVVAAVVTAAAGPGLAQYDKDGRYVPSPMGVPTDPYARPVPLYPGSPGGTTGTPIWPRGTLPPPLPPMVLTPRPADTVTVPYTTLPVPLTLEQCEQGWSKSTHVTPVEFRRRCHLMKRRAAKSK